MVTNTHASPSCSSCSWRDGDDPRKFLLTAFTALGMPSQTPRGIICTTYDTGMQLSRRSKGAGEGVAQEERAVPIDTYGPGGGIHDFLLWYLGLLVVCRWAYHSACGRYSTTILSSFALSSPLFPSSWWSMAHPSPPTQASRPFRTTTAAPSSLLHSPISNPLLSSHRNKQAPCWASSETSGTGACPSATSP